MAFSFSALSFRDKLMMLFLRFSSISRYSLKEKRKVGLARWVYLVAESCDLIGAEIIVNVKQAVQDGIFAKDENYPFLVDVGEQEVQELKEFKIKVEDNNFKIENNNKNSNNKHNNKNFNNSNNNKKLK